MKFQNPSRLPQIPEPTIIRLPWYLALLTTLKARNEVVISTTRMAEALEIAPSQVAKDLSFLGVRGKTRIGYEIDTLLDTLRNFLNFDRRHNAVMVGVGSLGAALVADSGLGRYGLNIVAGIDVDPALVGSSINGVDIYPPQELPELTQRLGLQIGVLAVPVESAQLASDQIVKAGIRAIWNFTPVRIKVPEGVVLTDTSIYSHLAVMYNRLAMMNFEG